MTGAQPAEVTHENVLPLIALNHFDLGRLDFQFCFIEHPDEFVKE